MAIRYSGATGRPMVGSRSSSGYDKNKNYSKAITEAVRTGRNQNEINRLLQERQAKMRGEGITGVQSGRKVLSQARGTTTTAYNPNINYDEMIRGLINRKAPSSEIRQAELAREAKIKGENITGVKTTADILKQYRQQATQRQAKPKFPTFEKYAQPAISALEERARLKYRPEFERYTFNPQTTRYGNVMAGSGGYMLGTAPNAFRDLTDQLNRQYAQEQESLRETILNQLINEYNRRFYEQAASPVTLNQILGYYNY